ncbi:MAG: ribosome biogenesis GTPase Der [Alphaproteobacteria bacterium]|nr:ribosome biogenesis GTPase Der [Alphaproteobacteria bacterium]
MPFTLAIAGRPNVGKSTLFNRLVGKQMAIVNDQPGVTRDWREGDGHLFDMKFRVIDTAGLEDVRAKGSIPLRTAKQTKQALEQAQVILLIVDARAGVTAEDTAIARELRKTGKPILLLANKCDGAVLPAAMEETVSLGFGDPLPISAAHGDGLMDVYELLTKYIPEEDVAAEKEDDEEKNLIIAVVGRPNAGKSTLINRLIGEDRMLTGPEPGLTRDAIPIAWEYRGQPVRLVDTAGMRRRSRINEVLERISVQESLRAIRLAHVVILVLDATQPFDKQELVIARHVIEEGRALVVALNKWDLVTDKKLVTKMIREKAEASLAQVAGVPLVPICALEGEGLEKLMRETMRMYDTWNLRVSTGKLNRWLEEMEANHPPPITANRRIKLRYMTQVKSRPPTFSLWVNKPVDLPESYQRFLTGGLRETFGLQGVPIRWQLKKSENPYEEKGKKR